MPETIAASSVQVLSHASKLMQNYVAETPVSAVGDLISFPDSAGNPVLLTVSNGGRVICLRPDPASDTGWAQSVTGLSLSAKPPAGSGARIAGGVGPEGKLVVFAVTSEGSQSLSFVEETPSGWSGPQVVGGTSSASPILAVSAAKAAGQLYVSYFVSVYPGPATAQAGPAPYIGWTGFWSSADHSLANQIAIGGALDNFEFVPGRTDVGGFSCFFARTPQIYTRFTTNYAGMITNDHHSGTPMNVEVWRGAPDPGYLLLGDVAMQVGGGYPNNPPGSALLTVTATLDHGGDPADQVIPNPIIPARDGNDTRIWSGKPIGSFWRFEHPGYVMLGHIASHDRNSYDGTHTYAMVREDLVTPGVIWRQRQKQLQPDLEKPANEQQAGWAELGNEYLIYWNALWPIGPLPFGSTPLSVDRIVPEENSPGIQAGTFYVHDSFDQPKGPAYCLSSERALESVVASWDADNRFIWRSKKTVGASITKLSATADSTGATRLFALLSTGAIAALDGKTGEWIKLGDGPFKGLAAASTESGLLQVFALDARHHICHAHRKSADGRDWSVFVPVESSRQYVKLAVCLVGDGHPECFAATAHGEMFRLFQDPVTTNWTVSEVELDDLRNTIEIRTYTTEITVTDDVAIPQPALAVSLWSDDLTVATINGAVQLLDNDVSQSFQTDPSGKIRIATVASDLNSPVFHAHIPASMATGDMLTIIPNEEIKQKLRIVDKATLVKELGIDENKVGDAAEALNAAMSLAPTAATARPSHIRIDSFKPGLHYRPAGTPSPAFLDPAAIPDQAWRLEVARGTVLFRHLTREELDADQAEFMPQGWTDWIGDLGDLAEAFADGIATAVTYTVEKLGNTIMATVKFVIEGVRYAFEQAMTRIEQIFDIVMVVFDAIGATFDALVKWLGFLFDWPDILRTKDALAHMVRQTLPVFKMAAELMRHDATKFIADGKKSLKRGTHDLLNDLKNDFKMDFTSGSVSTLKSPLPADVSDGISGTNIALDAVRSEANGSPGPARRRRARMASAEMMTDPSLQKLWSELQTLAGPGGPLVESEGFVNARLYMSRMQGSPDQFFTNAVSMIIGTLEGIAGSILDLAATVVDKVCSALAAVIDWLIGMLEHHWDDIPFLTALYEQHIAPGSKLTALDVCCLICAIPATLTQKIASPDHQPFFPGENDAQKEAALAHFKSWFTTAWIAGNIGLSQSTALASLNIPSQDRTIGSELASICICSAYLGYGVVEAFLDSFPVIGEGLAEPPIAFSTTALVLEVIIAATGVPYFTDPTNNGGWGIEPGAPLTNACYYFTAGMPFICDALSLGLSKQKVITRNLGPLGVGLNFFSGAVAGLGAAIPQIAGIVDDAPGYRDAKMIATFVVSWLASAAGTVAGLARLSSSSVFIEVAAGIDGGADVVLACTTYAQYLLLSWEN